MRQKGKLYYMLIGYARVSKNEQNLDLQLDALKAAGCEKIFTDKVTSLREERNGLDEALTFLRPGDVLVVWKLDRLGRTLRHLIDLIANFNQKGIGFKSLKETIDTTTSTGKLIFHIFGALAEFERDIIHERTNAGLEAARARGHNGGRPRSLNSKKVQMLRDLYSSRKHSIPELCQMLAISKTSLYRYVRPETQPQPAAEKE